MSSSSHKPPPGACDCHMHIYDPAFEALPGTNFPAQSATVADYRRVRERLGLTRTVVVQPTAYGTDNRCTLMAMRELAPARGVAILAPDTTDAEIERLDRLGMRGIRYHMLPGGHVTWESLPGMAARVARHGWHAQLQCETADLARHEKTLAALPCELVIDHIGRPHMPLAPDDAGWRALMRLVEDGRCWVKLSAPYHGSKSGPPRYDDVAALAQRLIRAAPERMLWATNWPHPSLKRDLPDDAALFDVFAAWVPDAASRSRILADNPARLYGF